MLSSDDQRDEQRAEAGRAGQRDRAGEQQRRQQRRPPTRPTKNRCSVVGAQLAGQQQRRALQRRELRARAAQRRPPLRQQLGQRRRDQQPRTSAAPYCRMTSVDRQLRRPAPPRASRSAAPAGMPSTSARAAGTSAACAAALQNGRPRAGVDHHRANDAADARRRRRQRPAIDDLAAARQPPGRQPGRRRIRRRQDREHAERQRSRGSATRFASPMHGAIGIQRPAQMKDGRAQPEQARARTPPRDARPVAEACAGRRRTAASSTCSTTNAPTDICVSTSITTSGQMGVLRRGASSSRPAAGCAAAAARVL